MRVRFAFSVVSIVVPLSLTLTTLAALGAVSGCDKTENPASTPPTPPASATGDTTPTPAPAPSATPPASVEAPTASAPPAESAVAPEGSATASAAVASASAAPHPSSPTPTSSATGATAAKEPECGKKPLPDCPLQGWMKTNMGRQWGKDDLPQMATLLDKIAGFAPREYAQWASIAKDGAKAARAGDLGAAKAACRTCHDQYKQKYKTEMRARKL